MKTSPFSAVLLIVSCFLLWQAPSAAAADVPRADFSASPPQWNAPATVNFTDSSTGQMTKWLWDFGDGAQSTTRNPVHVYTRPGKYTVTLTATSSEGKRYYKTVSVTVEPYVPAANGYVVHIDPASHSKFGLFYPATYKFQIPPGSRGLSAQHRHWEGDWRTLPEMQSGDFFNGVDAVRFDYARGFAYVSARFSRSSDYLYLRIVDAAGNPVAATFDSIPEYYDGRAAAVSVVLDDYSGAFASQFDNALRYLAADRLYFSTAIITGSAPWAAIQQNLDRYGDQMEVASHTSHHACSAADYTGYGYRAEIAGSRDAIAANLSYDAKPYVSLFVEPCGYSDESVQTAVTDADYLVIRCSNDFFSTGVAFIPWEAAQGRYGNGAVVYNDSRDGDTAQLVANANYLFDQVLAAGGIYTLMDHPSLGYWYDDSYLLQHLDHIKGRTNVWYVPYGRMYQYHFLQEMRGNLTVQPIPDAPPVASFSAAPVTGPPPLSVRFTDTSSGEITGWRWDFGDLNFSTAQNPTHVYPNTGTYTVKLTVSGPHGSDTRTETGMISVKRIPPTVALTAPGSGSTYVAPAMVPMTATATAGPGITVRRVDFYARGTLVGTSTAAPYGVTWNNVPAGAYTLTAKVTDSLGMTATSAPVPITVSSGVIPPPWTTRDIGAVGVAGAANGSDDAFTVAGSGSDLSGTLDSFRYVYQPFTGDGEIVARVDSLQGTNLLAKAGVMIRETLAANSAHATMALTPSNSGYFLRRSVRSGTTSTNALSSLAPPVWVKLERKGSAFTGYVSRDGSDWLRVGSISMAMANSVYIGLAVTSHNNSLLASAQMRGVTVVRMTPPAISITSPTNGASLTAPTAIDIKVSAAAGTGASIARVDFYAGSTRVATSSSSPYGATWSNVAAGSYSLTAKLLDSRGATATSAPVVVTVNNPHVQPPWVTRDVGLVGVPGSATYLNGLFTLKGSGAGIGLTADAFRFAYQPCTGDVEVVARLDSVQNVNGSAKAGIMIRETMSSNSMNAAMYATPSFTDGFSRRTTTGGTTAVNIITNVVPPSWVKLVRKGNVFTGYFSRDGVNWTEVGSSSIAMSSNAFVGLVMTSYNNTTLGTAMMSEVTVRPP